MRFLLALSVSVISPFAGATLMAGEEDHSADGIYGEPAIMAEQVVKAWQSTTQGGLIPWAPANVGYKLHEAGTGQAYAEISAPRHPVVGVLKFSTPVPIADGVVDFEYRVPSEIPARELHLNLRVAGSGKLLTMRLPVTTGAWRRETIPLAGIVGGDRWRLSSVRLAASVEVGLLVNGGGPADLQLRRFTVSRVPSPWGPLPVPGVLSATGDGVRRAFTVEGTPLQAWVQIIASNPVEVMLNGHDLGQAGFKNLDMTKWPSSPIPVAREFSLDGLLVPGPNTLVLKPVGNGTADLLCALGWVSGPNRNVLVSDAAWTGTGSEQAALTARPFADLASIPDIYPLREAQAWSPPAAPASPRTATLANTRPAITGLAGPWKTAEDAHDRWHLITPEGDPLYFLGIQVLGLFARENYRYYRTMMETYASEADFIADTLSQVRQLGFNGIAPAATTTAFFQAGRRAGFYNFQYLDSGAGGPFMKNYAGREEHHWADPFDPVWRQRYREKAQRFADRWRDDPSMIGVYVNNEMPLDGSVNGGSFIGYVYSNACRAAFAQWLTERYSHDLAKLKAAWSPELPAVATIKDFADATTLDLTPSPGRLVSAEQGHAAPRQFKEGKGPVQTDLYAFAVHAMSVYADFVLGVLREELPGKLIASNRFMGNATDEMLAAWKHYDLIGWNAYPFSQWQHGTYSAAQLANIRRAHRITGKPVIISETGLQALDARLPNPSAQLYTQRQRGEEYDRLLHQVHDKLPFVVGLTLFAWQNLSDTERQSWGIVDDHGHPYTDYAAGVERANKALLSSESLHP